jgi:CubicO group peptidase (beta-lactamase class C family)
MRNLGISAGVAALLLAAAPVSAQTPPPAVAAEPASQTLEALLPTLDAAFDRWQATAHAPGLIWGVVRDGRLIHVRGAGVRELEGQAAVEADTLFRIASMSKAFTALAILKLRDDGKLSLDAPAETYVPELAGWRYPTADSPRIRVRDLLNHTGGLVTDDPWGDRQQVLTEAEFTRMLTEGVPFTRAPGLAFEYSNFGYALLGRIVTNVSGRAYDQYIEAEIMRPLGMASSGYDIFASPQARRAIGYRWENEGWSREPDMIHGVFGAMGGVQTTAQDYARWIAFLLSAWPARDEPDAGPVRRSTVREMATGSNFITARTRTTADGNPCPGAGAYAMGLQVGTDCELGVSLVHGGGYPGYGSYMVLLPERNVGLFAFANRTYGAPVAPLMDAAAALVRAGLAPARTPEVSADLASAYRLAGDIWTAGDVAVGQDRLAMNFLMDRSVENWRTTLAQLKDQAGTCATDAPIVPNGALQGSFRWTCDKGRVDGRVLLAPTDPPTIQALNLRVTPNAPVN